LALVKIQHLTLSQPPLNSATTSTLWPFCTTC